MNVILVTFAKEEQSHLFPREQWGRGRSVMVPLTEAMVHRGQTKET